MSYLTTIREQMPGDQAFNIGLPGDHLAAQADTGRLYFFLFNPAIKPLLIWPQAFLSLSSFH